MLEESRQIEVAQLAEFMADDEKFLDSLLDEAGMGHNGDYERFKLSMASYWLKGARSYLESIVDTWLARGDVEIEEEYRDPPVTIVTPSTVVTVKDDTIKTTYVNNATKETGEAEVIEPSSSWVPAPSPSDKWAQPPKNSPVVVVPAAEDKKPWVPKWKDEDKITEILLEILEDTPEDARNRPGFQGWLAGSATAALGGKTEPNLMLKKVGEVLGGS